MVRLTGGTPADVVLDETRQRLYLINNSTSQVLVFDYTTSTVVASIPVGKSPISGALAMDGSFLYVTSGATPTQTASGSPLLNVIDLGQQRVAQSVLLPAIPQGVEVGNDGRALVAMLGSGVVGGVPQNTLAVFDPTLNTGQQLQSVIVPALPTTPAPLPPATLGRPTKIFTGALKRTPDGQFIVGVIPTAAPTSVNSTNGSTYVFVYEVASGIVLRNRAINGSSTVISMAPDGSRFMAGMTMYDTATLSVVAQQNNANAPFSYTAAVNTLQNVGGSAYSPDGSTIYSAFNTAVSTNPAPPALASTLLVGDPANLGIRLGIKLPESIVAKMVILSDGSEAWGLSDSGLVHLPLGHLYDYPILMPETTQVFLAFDDCNRGVASGVLKMNNLGKGRLTFAVQPTGNSATVYEQSSGLAPSTVTFTMEPGRSGVSRQPGTNMWTGAGTSQGVPVNVTISSPDAINVPPVIRLYMNYRQPDQRGVIYPVPTAPNNNPNIAASTAGNEGLQDLLLDEARGRLYITNSGYNRIEVFDLVKQHFIDPIPAGQLPHQMAMGSDGNTLYVGNTGGESISIVDLTMGKVVDTVQFPAIPRNGTAALIYPRTMAMGLYGLQFVMSDGSQWKVVGGNQATVRVADSVTPVRFAGAPNIGMLATADNRYIVTLNGSGLAYLYDGVSDAYVSSRQLFTGTIQGYYGVLGAGPGGDYFLADGLIMNSALTVTGGSAQPGATTVTGGGGGFGGLPPTVTVVNTGQRNVAAVAPLTDTTFLRLTTPVRQTITTQTRDDSRTTLEILDLTTNSQSLAGVAPENPIVSVFGTTRFNTTPRQMVVDSAGTTAYAITLSGLSVISLAPTGSATRPSIASARAVVNASDGSANIKPGSFITINGTNLGAAAVADMIPPPTVLGGSCVTFGDVAVPLLSTSNGQIQAQVPDTLKAGTQVVTVRSLATAQDSDPITVTVRVN